MSAPQRTPVAVVGGGPAGLMLALLLDHHGVPSVVFDHGESGQRRPDGSTPGARTMEHLRRLGLAGPVRRLGLPGEHPGDLACFTRFGGRELSRLALPTATERLRRVAAAPRTDQLPEPPHHADRMYLAGFLREHAGTRPNITLRPGWRVTDLRQDARQVLVRAEHPDHPGEDWTARYAVGSDSGRDFVRDALGVRDEATGPRRPAAARLGDRRATAAHLRLPTFHRDRLGGPRAWSYWALDEDPAVNLIALNGEDEFLLLAAPARGGHPGHPADPGALLRRAAGADLPVEVLGDHRWTPGATPVAQRFGKGRVFLTSDADPAPADDGGLGMNTGIDDAANLAWKLAAVLRGWGGPGLLASYGGERRPIALRNAAAARELGAGPGAVARPAALEADTAEGRAARADLGALLRSHGERSLSSVGVQLGVRYDASPIVAGDPQAEPPGDSWGSYTPSSLPGGRAPHLWLDDWHGQGSSLFDRLGPGYTLLRLGPEPPSGKPLQAAAQARGLPLRVLDVEGEPARELYQRDLVLIRPDQHVAWRGNQLPTDPGDLVARVSGAGQRRSGAWAA
ncbi:FAD-dependent monooxygenase [Streptacidiphilus sp. P02-A3a]|uniref:FAD-dependent monooxygenase n=1 Tax=Streptacidiphilus sp. P02-A3a TaxID=2704468 RepID=UPI0015F9224B|nr:FAD-dependent monooxygenase [Streptacidiphilus sp. P02-A3a]QMU71558.1 monooxygenase [Streptacidiphilus sp. P02-A3a]